jgi:predicted AlkP superfamily pyrophosphatase or phosphodiesterase
MINKFIFAFFCLLSGERIRAQDTTQQIVRGRSNSKLQQEKPYVILISADGFRYDFAKKYGAENLLRLSKEGVAASSMIASFPTLTFPNHYTIVTGLYPAHHGLVNNFFYDRNKKLSYAMSKSNTVRDSSWYGGTPLWVLAEEQDMLSASFYWVGSEAAMHGLLPTYYYYYNEKISIDDRIQVVKDWLQLPAEKRPHMITFYLPEVDHAAHRYGPESKETGEAVQFVDKAIGRMMAGINPLQLPVNFIFVSDHGMTTVDTVQGMALPVAVDTSKFIISASDAFLQLYAKDINDVAPVYTKLKEGARDYDVYLSGQMPHRWHYSKADDAYNRIGDIILIPHLPKVFNIGGRRITPGKHGFDPALPDMHATFFAWGPAFKQNKKTGDFENVNVYPLVAKILGLDYREKIDGKLKVLKKILK